MSGSGSVCRSTNGRWPPNSWFSLENQRARSGADRDTDETVAKYARNIGGVFLSTSKSRGRAMTNHSVIAASGKTHAKIAFLALALSAVFVAVVSTSKSDALGTRTQVVKASTIMQVA